MLLTTLRRRDQATAAAIEAVAQTPQLAEQQPQTYSTTALVARVEAVANQDAEVRQVAQEIQARLQQGRYLLAWSGCYT